MNSKYKASSVENIKLNQITYQRYFDWLKELAVSMFEWENLPSGCDSKFLERTLFDRGQILFFYDEVLDEFLHLPFSNSGKLDVYGYPLTRHAYAVNGYNTNKGKEDSVIIYNNTLQKADIMVAEYYGKQIYEIKRAIDVNVSTQKFPYFITAPQSQINTMKNLYKKVNENEVMILASDKLMDFSSIQVLPTKAEFISDRLYNLYKDVMSEACEYFGINSNSDKKERMIVSEVMNGVGMSEANRQIRLKVRKDACNHINKMFDLDIDVKFRKDIDMFENFIEHEYAQSFSTRVGGEQYE